MTGVFISVTRKCYIGIKANNQLVIKYRDDSYVSEIEIGEATKEQIDVFIANFEQLKVHTRD